MAKPVVLSRGFVALGVVLGLCYALWPGSAVGSVAGLAISVGTAAATAFGPRLNGSSQRQAWRFLTAATLMFLLGMLARPWSSTQAGPLVLTADLFTLTGYLAMTLGLVALLRGSGTLDRNAVIDGAIVSLGMAAPAVQYLALPAAAITGRPPVISWLAGLYPVIDILVVFIIVNLAFSTAVRLTSFRWIAVSASMLFVGDLGYAVIGARGHLTGPPIMDLPFLLGFVALGAAALHPSMTRFATIVSQPIQPWSALRLSLIVPALVAPFVVLLATREVDTGRRVAIVLTALVTISLVARAVTAVRRLAETQAQWLYLATHDSLTGLPNRTSLVTRVGEHLQARAAGSVWLVYLDLDGFKLVNDHWGHSIGDRLLQEVGRRLEAALRPEGCDVYRTGGDEFVVTGVGGRERAERVGSQIVELLRHAVELDGMELITTGSVGIVVHADQPSAEEMLRDADVAMYRSKAAGHDRSTTFDTTMRDVVRHRVETELALRRALLNDELWIAYQPLVRVTDGAVIGAEALVRWAHPTRGLVPPDEFIGIAEETGLICDLGSWVLRTAIDQLGAWRRAGRVDAGFGLSVNVSAHQLNDPALLQIVRDAIVSGIIGPGDLTIELTESALMQDAEEAARVLTELRALGAAVSVDDFGTGYSSLSYLSKLPVTGVKIDRSFVRHLGERAQAEDIARAIVAMSDSLGLEVTAEGVETPVQHEVIRLLGVAKGQGWLWGKPIDADAFAATHCPPLRPTAVVAPRTPSTPEHPGVSA